MIRQPICVYNNWSTYDELSDNVFLTQELAMKELDEVLRLREAGVRIDYYLMDAFWFAPDGGYRTWRKPHWPDGPEQWINKCLENGVKPGMWFSTNATCHNQPVPEWEDSMDVARTSMCLFKGGYLPHFMETLQYWYDKGIRLFKFDFANFDAATPDVLRTHLTEEIRERNIAAFKSALKLFRYKNPDAVLLAFNGFGGEYSITSRPFRKSVDTNWLTVFDSLYCGDPRPSDVPAANFWRSVDIYTDHMTRAYEASDVPLERIDNTGYMMGVTGTCYCRGASAWKGMLVLTLARGGWVNVYHGNLELLSDEDAKWFAKTQSMFLNFQARGRVYTFGEPPGEAKSYGYAGIDKTGSVYTVVNASQLIAEVSLPRVSDWQDEPADWRILFRDAGFVSKLSGSTITLGPEQMAIVGFGSYASEEFDLGIQEDVVIASDISLITDDFTLSAKNAITTQIAAPSECGLRIVMRQVRNGLAIRSSGGGMPNGIPMDQFFKISVCQDGVELPVNVNYGKAIWSGFSWAVGEVDAGDMTPGEPVTVSITSNEGREVTLLGAVYSVKY